MCNSFLLSSQTEHALAKCVLGANEAGRILPFTFRFRLFFHEARH